MPGKEQSIDVVCGIFPPILMEHRSTPCQTQGGKAVVLSNDKISGLRPIRKSKIYAVGTFVEHKGLCSIPVELMCRIAKQ